MTSLIEMLDKAKELRSLPSDAALARELGVTRGAVSSWRTGLKTPSDEVCEELAHLIGEKPLKVVGIVHAMQAKTNKARKMWERFASAAALIIAVSVGSVPGKASATPYPGGDGISNESARVIHYAQFRAGVMQRPSGCRWCCTKC